MSESRVTHEEAELIRRCAYLSGGAGAEQKQEAAAVLDNNGRFWQPIEYAVASGRAKCRECDNKIGRDESCVAFGFDPYGGQDSWGRGVQRAYIHTSCDKETE